MIINVAQISEDEGLDIRHVYPEGKPGLRSDESRIIGRPEVNLRATRSGEEVTLVGDVHAAVEFDCDRCLTPLSIPIEQSFNLIYIPPVKPGSAQDEKELGDEDLEIAFYQNQMIDIDDLVREQIELALPMARACSEDCRGLCPECGANLNEGKCACVVEEVDPRWAALKHLEK